MQSANPHFHMMIDKCKDRQAYRLRDDESSKQEPRWVVEGAQNSSHLDIGRYSNSQHPIESEECKRQVHEEQIPEELGCRKHSKAGSDLYMLVNYAC